MNTIANRLFIVFLFGLVVFHQPLLAQSEAGDKPANVVIQSLQFEAQQSTIEAVGSAEAVRSVDIYPAAADNVIAIHFSPGQRVLKGEILLELDARRQTAALQRAKIQLADAKRNLTRLQTSKAKGASTQSALDDASTAKALAEVVILEAQAELQDRTLLAPFDGVVGLTDIEVGDRISTNTLVTTLDERSSLFVNFTAPEASLDVLLSNAQVSIVPWSQRQITLQAKVVEVDSRINPTDRTIRARAIFENKGDVYRPGMSFRVRLTMLGQQYAVIPEAGLSWGATGAYVWIVKNAKAHKIPVQIKQRLRGKILVEGDLNQGQDLVVEGIQRLRENQSVSVITQG